MKDTPFTEARLLSLYDRVAEAEDAIPRLRRFVLDLAVRGKLVPQEAGDESASVLLERIEKEKARLVKAGEIRKAKQSANAELKLIPFRLPDGWRPVFLGGIIDLLSGQHLQPNEYSTKDGAGVPYITGPSDFGESGLSITRFALVRKAVARRGQLLLTVKGSGVGKTTVCEIDEVAISRQLMAITPIIWSISFLDVVTHRLAEVLQEQARSLIPGIAREDVEQFAFGLPPLAEQHRIVAKVEELMALLDRLETARAAREETRTRLTAATLSRLTEADTDTPTAARFALQTLPALTTRPDQIKTLRQTILNLAVRGKLVEQDPSDEPARELLHRIAKERTKHNRRSPELPEMDNPDELGELPPNWAATPLISIGSWAIGAGFPKNEQGLSDGPFFFLKVSDMNLPGNEKYINFGNNYIDAEAASRMRAKIHPPGTIIFPKIGGAIATNKRRILTRASAIDNNCLGITFAREVCTEWAYLLMTSIDLTKYQAGTAVPALQQGVLERIPIPLPPLAEQHRIVAKIEELMSLCDRLERTLQDATTTRARLLDATLREALASAQEAA